MPVHSPSHPFHPVVDVIDLNLQADRSKGGGRFLGPKGKAYGDKDKE
jgi:hypothetical protein